MADTGEDEYVEELSVDDKEALWPALDCNVEDALKEDDDTTPHPPNPAWQPAPQYASVLPQYEY